MGLSSVQAEKNAVKNKHLRQLLENLEDKMKIVQINIEATKLKVLLSIA